MTKFVISSKSISEVVKLLSKTIAETETRMILKCYLGTVDKAKQQLVLFGTDLNLGAVVMLPLASLEGDEVSFTIEAKVLKDLVDCNKDADLVFEIQDLKTKVKVRAEDREVDLELNGLNPAEFPKMQNIGDLQYDHNIDLDNFRKCLEVVSYAMSTTATKIDLMGVFINGKQFVASNGQRLQSCNSESESLNLPAMVIPDSAVKQLIATLPEYLAKGVTSIQIGFWNQFILFKMGEDLFSVRKRAGEYSKRVLSVLNQDAKYKPELQMTADTKKLASLVGTVRLSADENDQRVKFDIGDGKLTLSARNVRGNTATAKMNVAWAGPAYSIVLSGDYIVEALRSVQADSAVIKFSEIQTQPIYIVTDTTKAVVATVVSPVAAKAAPKAATKEAAKVEAPIAPA